MKASKYNVFVDCKPDAAYIAFNCVSGGFYVLDNQKYDLLRSILSDPGQQLNHEAEKIRETLIKSRFLVDDEMDEAEVLKLRNNTNRFNPVDMSLVIAPTLGCNLSCPYCYVDRKKTKMNRDTIDGLKKYFADKMVPKGIGEVVWTGGEPLLALDIVEELNRFFMDHCRELGSRFQCSFITNGYLLTEDNIKRLQACGINSVQITLDGMAEYHDRTRITTTGRSTFSTILENIITATHNELRVTLRSNIHKGNYESIYPLLDHLASLPIKKENISFAPCKVTVDQNNDCKPTDCDVFSNEAFAALEPKLHLYAAAKGFKMNRGVLTTRAIYCGANTLPLNVIDSEGNVLKCWCNLGNTKRNKVGKITSDGKLEYSNVNALAHWMAWDPFDFPQCKACAVLPLCMGGCMYYNIMNKTPDIELGCSARKYNLEEMLKVFYLCNTKTPDQLAKSIADFDIGERETK